MVSVDNMLISILSVLVEALEMSCADAAAKVLTSRASDLMTDENLASNVQPQESKFILYPVLTFCYLFWVLSRL